ncbi:Mobile element protein [Geobacillus proteiniphilus]|uniref:Mobile element protein n=1 Tax=Geobacillus proteiniphilus TaxID=860353 RepID=A0A1Q5SM07_9BACL|nr:Mobile element protein [Geobacillus proteiniphilus]OPX03577.1 hypothetical protein B1A75_07965 [Geobacillus sp. LEMMY01]
MKHDHISFKEYTMDNLSLPINIADLIPRHNNAVHEIGERIPMETFLPYYKGGGHLHHTHQVKNFGSSPQHILDKQYVFLYKDVQKSLIY